VVDVYKAALGWSSYIGLIEPLGITLRASFNSVTALAAYLQRRPVLSAETPYPVKLQGVELGNPEIVFAAFDGCYIDLDLSECTGTELGLPYGYGNSNVNLLNRDKLVSVTLPNTVTSITRWAFNRCTALTSISLPSSLLSIEDGAFSVCTSLTTVNLPSSITSIGYQSFTNCTALKSIDLPSSVNYIGNFAFSGCTALTVTIVRAATPPALQLFGSAYYTWDGTSSAIYVPNASVNDYTSAPGWGSYADRIKPISE
jgi:hypothetical protein